MFKKLWNMPCKQHQQNTLKGMPSYAAKEVNVLFTPINKSAALDNMVANPALALDGPVLRYKEQTLRQMLHFHRVLKGLPSTCKSVSLLK